MTARPASRFLIEHECCLIPEGDTHLSRDEMFFSEYNVPRLFALIANDQLISYCTWERMRLTLPWEALSYGRMDTYREKSWKPSWWSSGLPTCIFQAMEFSKTHFWKGVHTTLGKLFQWITTFIRNKHLCGLSCLASSSSIWIWFKPSLAILKTHYQIRGHCVGTCRSKFYSQELIRLESKLAWLLEDPAMRQPGVQYGLFYPTSSMVQIHRLWSSHRSFKFNMLCSLRYFLAFSIVLTVSLWNSSPLFMYCWDCRQQYWRQYFNSGCAVTEYMHVADSAVIQYYTVYAADFGSNFARSATRRNKNSFLSDYPPGSSTPKVLFRGADSQDGVPYSVSMV